MKFNGASAVQVRTPRNVADLAAYTSLKFYISLSAHAVQDNSTQFVFYLGNKDVSIFTSTQRLNLFSFISFDSVSYFMFGLLGVFHLFKFRSLVPFITLQYSVFDTCFSFCL